MKKGIRKNSIFVRIFIPVLLLLFMQAIVLQILMYAFRVYGDLTDNAYKILSERVEGRKNQINSFLHTGTDLDATEGYLRELYERYATDVGSPSLFADDSAQKDFLWNASEHLIATLRRNQVNGIFVILNNDRDYSPPGEDTVDRIGLSIRDQETTTGYVNKEDLLINRGSSVLVDKLGLYLDSCYEPYYTLNASSDFYFKPLKAALDQPAEEFDNLAYFQSTYRLSDDVTDVDVLSYSVPLRSEGGAVFGVLGVEITADYFRSLMPDAELTGKSKSAYALAQSTDESAYTVNVHSGTYFKRVFGDNDAITVADKLNENCYEFVSEESAVCGSIAAFDIYNNNAYFAAEQLVLIGVVDRDELHAFGSKIQINIVISLLISVAVGVVCLVVIIRRMVSPIRKLYEKVRESDSPTELHFEKTNINEIDRLTESIEELGRKVNANKAKSEFFSRMSHDMRTPMNAIIGLSSRELTENASEEQKAEHLRQINESGKYLLGLINDILDINKLESEKIELIRRPVGLSEAWSMVVPIIGEIAAQKNIEFIRNVDEIENFVVLMDVKRFSQIFINLLSNAVKFTEPGGKVELCISVARDESVVTQKVVVRDTGTGMSKEFQRVMFEQFVQENPEKEGTGLGLSIAKSLVELMGGTIDFKSEQGKGTEFTVVISCCAADQAETDATESPASAPVSELVFAGKKILICEDNEINAEIAAELLVNKDAVCEFAEDGRVGVDRFAASPVGYYDAILMDMRMPVMDGLSATKAIRAMPRPDATAIRVIAMTANAFDEDIDACLAAGMNAHIAKPIDPEVFYTVIAAELGKRKPK